MNSCYSFFPFSLFNKCHFSLYFLLQSNVSPPISAVLAKGLGLPYFVLFEVIKLSLLNLFGFSSFESFFFFLLLLPFRWPPSSKSAPHDSSCFIIKKYYNLFCRLIISSVGHLLLRIINSVRVIDFTQRRGAVTERSFTGPRYLTSWWHVIDISRVPITQGDTFAILLLLIKEQLSWIPITLMTKEFLMIKVLIKFNLFKKWVTFNMF